MKTLKKILIIQTAHIGDVVLALPVAQRLRSAYPDAQIHFLLRNGNQNLVENHPAVDSVHTLDRKHKYSSMFRLIQTCRQEKFDLCVNLQRFFTSGFIAAFSGASRIIGFQKNPWSFRYSDAYPHIIHVDGSGGHEVERNLSLLEGMATTQIERPQLYPSEADREKVTAYQSEPYYVIAPASVWKTKALPEEKWIELVNRLSTQRNIIIIGASTDYTLAEGIREKSLNPSSFINLCGALSLLQSAVIIGSAIKTFTNDSAPLHLASAMNAPVRSFFLSTVPEFGFGPLSEDSKMIQVSGLDCRPCGLHGYKVCPKGHFKCAYDIDVSSVSF